MKFTPILLSPLSFIILCPAPYKCFLKYQLKMLQNTSNISTFSPNHTLSWNSLLFQKFLFPYWMPLFIKIYISLLYGKTFYPIFKFLSWKYKQAFCPFPCITLCPCIARFPLCLWVSAHVHGRSTHSVNLSPFLFITARRSGSRICWGCSGSGQAPCACWPLPVGVQHSPAPERRRALRSGSLLLAVRLESAWQPRCSSSADSNISHPVHTGTKMKGREGTDYSSLPLFKEAEGAWNIQNTTNTPRIEALGWVPFSPSIHPSNYLWAKWYKAEVDKNRVTEVYMRTQRWVKLQLLTRLKTQKKGEEDWAASPQSSAVD